MCTDRDERLTVALVNFSGTGADSGEDRRQVLAGLLRAESAQVVLCQQVPGEEPDDICRDLQSAVREAGMTAMAVRRASQPDPAGRPGCHTAILVRGSAGLDIVDTGPADVPWSEALLTVAGIPHPVRFYSTSLPDGSKTRQRQYATQLAGRGTALARADGELAFAGGNWNCLAPADNYTQPQLRRMPERSHLAAIDMWCDDTLEPVLDVHNALDDAGLADVAASVPLRYRYPPELRPTGRGGAHLPRLCSPGSRQGRRQLPAGPQRRRRRPGRNGHRSRRSQAQPPGGTAMTPVKAITPDFGGYAATFEVSQLPGTYSRYSCPLRAQRHRPRRGTLAAYGTSKRRDIS